MSSIPGIEKYPELAAKLRVSLAEAKAKKTDCAGCEENRVYARYRVLLNERVGRDKLRSIV